MALSGSYDFTLNRNQIIYAAMRLIGVKGEGQTPTSDAVNDAAEALNVMVKGWQTQGVGLWLNQPCTLFLGLSQESYSLGPSGDHCTASSVETALAADAASGAVSMTVDSITGIADGDYLGIVLDDGSLFWTTVNGTPSGVTVVFDDALTDDAATDNAVYAYTTKVQRPLEIREARFIGSNEIPLDKVNRERFFSLADKSTQGKVNQYWYDPQLTNGRLYVWPTCDLVTDQIKLTLKLPFQDFDAITDNADFPAEWLRALKYNLALEIAPEYQIVSMPSVEREALRSFALAKAFDAEDGPIECVPRLY